jgi:purine nucleoside phosphorylase
MTYTRTDYDQAVQAIRRHNAHHPEVGLVLGSGLGGLADELRNATVIP